MKIDIMLRAGGQAACVALLLSFSAALGVSTADAASTSARATKVASKLTPAPADAEDPQTTSSVAVNDDRCQRTRKRLWVEGEGWVVRRVTTCF